MEHVDTLVVGQGLAGSLLAMMLDERDVPVRLIDSGHQGSASLAAAGILSPYTGPRYKAPDNLSELLDSAHTTYRALERALDVRIFTAMPIWRLLQSAEEAERIQQRREAHAPSPYLDAPQDDALPRGVLAPYGAARLSGGGRVALGRLLGAARHRFAATDRLIEAELRPEALALERDGGVRWQRWRAKRVIFCDGAGAFTNPWWSDLPWRRARGESLTLTTHDSHCMPETIVTGRKSLVPLDDGSFRLGATYERGIAAGEPTSAARDELLSALPSILAQPPNVRVLAGYAGVRPGAHPGPPFVGFHHADARIGILNGFGSRGTLLGPWHAARLADHIAFGHPLPASADIRQRRDLS